MVYICIYIYIYIYIIYIYILLGTNTKLIQQQSSVFVCSLTDVDYYVSLAALSAVP